MKRRLTLIISALMLMITNVAWGQSDYKRISDIAQLDNGSRVVFAARYNTTENEYYAMTAQASGKPTGVLFTSVVDTDETLPSSIMDEVSTFYWNVAIEDGNYTFTNVNGDVLGYTSSTNFATGGDNTAWAISYQTSEATAMVPEYSAFVVNNVNIEIRAIALNSNHNFGPYNTQNIAAANYNFFLDIFASEGGIEPCATPTFNPAAGTYTEAQEVTINCGTPDATIYYTLDGSNPTVDSDVYSEPIVISETTTVKAMAAKEGFDNSSIATATYTIQDTPTVITIAEARALAVNEHAMVQGVVTFIDGKNVYVQDETAGICLFLNSTVSTLALGDMVIAYGTRTDYKGLVELSGINPTDPSQFDVISTGNALPVAVMTVAEILADASGSNMLQSTRVQIVEATIGTINNNNNTPITQDGSTINIYKMPVVDGLVEGDIVTFIGVISCYNNPQMRIASANDVTYTHPQSDTVETPTFAPAAGTYYETQYVTIECATEGATIYYTVDGSNPSTESPVFTEAIEISETTTVKAFAVKEGLTDSQIATAVYTITDAPTPSNYIRLNDVSQLTNGAKVIFAARYNGNANEYYAMTAVASGKPTGVLFTSVYNDGETLPSTISDEESVYYWNVTTDGTNFTFTNAAGDVLGYTSSTNFAPGGDNIAWTITAATSPESSMVPDYDAFNVINGNVTNRAFALNSNHNYGAYHIQNMPSADYNFFVDMFATEGSGAQYCSMPAFTPAAGTYFEAQNVTINCATEGATIYYTLDESTPTTSSSVYTEPLVISETTTVKAMAVKEGYENSNVATAEYIIEDAPTVITIAEAKALEPNEYAMVQGIATFIDGRNVYIQDETAGIVLYLNANTVPSDLDAGDLVQAYGKRSAYNGLIELTGIDGTSSSEFSIISSGNELPLETVTIAEILADYADANMLQSTRVKIIEATIGAINNSGSTPITQDGNEMTIYKLPVVEGLVEGDIVTFIGVIGCFNNPQMRIASADDIEFYHPGGDPVLVATPNALSGFNYIVGHGPSEAQSFILTGSNLPIGFLTISVDNGFEISLNPEIYTGVSITIPVDNPTLEPTTVYVRLNAETVGQYVGTITIEDTVEITVSLSGEVVADGIDETLASSVSVWNNSNELVIENGSNEMLNVVVYNIVGQPVLSETVTTGNNVIRHSLAEGVYIVRIANSKEMTGIKVVVRR